MRAFIKMREALTNYQELKLEIEKMKTKYDYQFKTHTFAIEQLCEDVQRIYELLEPPKDLPPKTPKRKNQ